MCLPFEGKRVMILWVSLISISAFHYGFTESLEEKGDSSYSDSPEEEDVWSLHEFQVVQDNQTTTQTTQNATVFTMSTTMVPSPLIHSHCEVLLRKLGDRAAHFTRCSLLHARPLGLCSGCMYEYTDFMKAFDAINQPQHKDPTGDKSCAEVLLASDMTQIVGKTHQFIQSLWEASTCEQCFDIGVEVNGSLNYSLSNTTLLFQGMANDTLLCFAQHTNKTTVASPVDTSSVADDVCTACKEQYNKLNILYNSLKDKGKLCVDIVDSMNFTRYTWSHRFGCLKQEQDIVAVVAMAVGFCLLPVFFYIGSKINVEKIEKKLLKQKRFQPLSATSALQ